MKLSQLLSLYPQLKWGDFATSEVINVTRDSRQVAEGSVFVAIKGSKLDGHDLIGEAVRSGAIGLVVEDDAKIPEDYSGAVILVDNSRDALNKLASRYYGQPADQLFCVGVTGTNGKTSISLMVESILNHYGWKTGVLGTIDHHIGEHKWTTSLTTPDPIELHKRISEFVALGARAVAFEVSSIALDQNRADSVPFDCVVFTNLTRDHLDYHKTMENYFNSKAKLFNELLWTSTKESKFAIINGDDPYGEQMQVANNARVWSYGQKDCDFQFKVKELSFTQSIFELSSPRGEVEVILPIVGLHNVYNATAAIAVSVAAGCSVEVARDSLSHFKGVPGRLQSVTNDRQLNLFVDYAHTDDALRSVLSTLGEIKNRSSIDQRIITVFGCGGDRDKGKRPAMCEAALEGSDLVFVTSDNPRTEDPQSIIDECIANVSNDLINKKLYTDIDRRQAIGRAIQTARPNDVILVAGKGHEDYQIVGTQKLPFSDVAVIQELLD